MQICGKKPAAKAATPKPVKKEKPKEEGSRKRASEKKVRDSAAPELLGRPAGQGNRSAQPLFRAGLFFSTRLRTDCGLWIAARVCWRSWKGWRGMAVEEGPTAPAVLRTGARAAFGQVDTAGAYAIPHSQQAGTQLPLAATH